VLFGKEFVRKLEKVRFKPGTNRCT